VGIVQLAALLSSAASDCAASLIPNMKAACAASITGLTTTIAQVAGSGLFIASGCRGQPDVLFKGVPPGVTPSNVGRVTSPQAPARRLVFGGGKGATSTHCAINIINVGWALAQAGLAISASSGHTGFGGCPPKLHKLKPFLPPGIIDEKITKYGNAYCVADAFGVLTFIAGVVSYISMATIQCSDVLNLDAFCTAGISGVIASTSAMVQASSGIYVACKEIVGSPFLLTLIETLRSLDDVTGNKISSLVDPLLGRRLFEGAGGESIEALKREYDSPADVWKSIGFDLNDRDAEYRKQKVQYPSAAEQRDAFRDPESTASEFASGGRTCPHR